MAYIHFEWDENKAKTNIQKHGISFEEAKSSFFDPFARVIFDPEHSEGEDRFLLLGISSVLNVLIVSHCYKDDNENIRIISARKANKSEEKQYREFRDEDKL